MKVSSRFTRFTRGGAWLTLLLCIALSGCVVTGDGVTYDADGYVDASYDTGVDYVEPTGVVVGGWATGYNVAPPGPRRIGGGPPNGPRQEPGRNIPRNPVQGGIHPTLSGNGTHAYTPAPASHSAPSIPSAHRK
jgi:hypothetical protein